MKNKRFICLLAMVCLGASFHWADLRLVHWPSPDKLSNTRNLNDQAFRGAAPSILETVLPKDRAAKQVHRPIRREGYEPIDFRSLSVEMEKGPNGCLQARLPKAVEKLDGCKVGISGFAIPMTRSSQGPNTILLFESRDAIRAGLEPHLDRWVFVEMDRSAQVPLDRPVTCFGVLQVRPTVILGQIQCLYRLELQSMEVENPDVAR